MLMAIAGRHRVATKVHGRLRVSADPSLRIQAALVALGAVRQKGSGKAAGLLSRGFFMWVWVKTKPAGDHRVWSMLPLTRVPFWVPMFDPQPCHYMAMNFKSCLKSDWWTSMPPNYDGPPKGSLIKFHTHMCILQSFPCMLQLLVIL